MKLFEVGDLVIHPERYENDRYGGAYLIVDIEDTNTMQSIPDWRYHVVHQRTGEKSVKSAYGFYFGVERGFLTHVSGGATNSLSD